MRKETGFTLIELIMVIVILGILAVTALPKFIDLRTSAAQQATAGVAGALNSAFSINYSTYIANSSLAVSITATANACNAVQVTGTAGILQGGLPAGYSVTGAVACGVAGSTGTCAVYNTAYAAQSTTATLICTG